MEPVEVLSLAFGWVATVLWSLSFYPQILLNFQRKSVQGLSIDFVALNVFGFGCYLVANCGLLFSSAVRDEYALRHDGGRPSVRWNDVAFAAHALFASAVTLLQTFTYAREPRQTVSAVNRTVLTLLFVVIATALVLAGITESGARPGVATFPRKDDTLIVEWLDLVLLLSTVKVYISFAKYVPQAWTNYRRKSTVGWSILNILCDLTGGLLSFGQMLIDAHLADDWDSLTSNPGKLGISVLSIAFDLVFVVQHYVLYRHSRDGIILAADESRPLLD